MKTETTKMNASVNSTTDSPASATPRSNRHRRREVAVRSAGWRGRGRVRAENDQCLSEQKFTTPPTASRPQ
jgi:hypothetical protein